MPNLRNPTLRLISTPLKIITGHLQEHQSHSDTAININPDLNAEAALKYNCFQNSNNHITTTSETAPAPTTSVPAANYTLATMSDTPEEPPTFLSKLPSDTPLEAPTSDPDSEPRDSPSTEPSNYPPGISPEEPN